LVFVKLGPDWCGYQSGEGGKKKKKEGVKGTKGFSLEKMGPKSPHHEGEKKKPQFAIFRE
jgi:hypothetical protein